MSLNFIFMSCLHTWSECTILTVGAESMSWWSCKLIYFFKSQMEESINISYIHIFWLSIKNKIINSARIMWKTTTSKARLCGFFACVSKYLWAIINPILTNKIGITNQLKLNNKQPPVFGNSKFIKQFAFFFFLQALKAREIITVMILSFRTDMPG